jgi:mRNA interferase RelE/StbE
LAWTIKIKPTADKQLSDLDRPIQKRIRKFLIERIAPLGNPRSVGEALSGPLGDYWKYRIGEYRIICDIQDNVITILVLAIGDRKQVYRR